MMQLFAPKKGLQIMWKVLVSAAMLAGALLPAHAEPAAPPAHRLALQITDADSMRMNMLLNIAGNVLEHYAQKHESVAVRVVAFGPGLSMLRADVSPVKDQLAAFMKKDPAVEFDACNNTLQAMAKKEGKVPPLVSGAVVVPSGAATLLELNEQGWTVLRP
jgi:intracellular sulfur oxidation DsrE/DsrF family protein